MLRLVYVLGSAYVLLCAWVVRSRHVPEPAYVLAQPAVAPAVPVATTGDVWFQRMRPHCNAVEVATHMRADPPARTPDALGYAAACWALAGQIDSARAAILSLEPTHRGRAAGILFGIGHPVADAGDDQSAGPMMSLVVEFWPDNYMALYHAGASNFILGEHALARTQLERFLQLYGSEDGWRRNAIELLDRMGAR